MRVVLLAVATAEPRRVRWRVASAPVERAIAVGSVVESLLGQVNAVAAFALALGEAAGAGEAEAAGDGDAVTRLPPGDGLELPPPPHAASNDSVIKSVANLRNIAILIINSGGGSVASSKRAAEV
jgi:hypothetical protein